MKSYSGRWRGWRQALIDRAVTFPSGFVDDGLLVEQSELPLTWFGDDDLTLRSVVNVPHDPEVLVYLDGLG